MTADEHCVYLPLQSRQVCIVRKHVQAMAASSPAATAVSTTIVLKQCELAFGDTVRAVGESDLFGSWDSNKAPQLQWQEGHDWQAKLDVPAGDCTFKVTMPSHCYCSHCTKLDCLCKKTVVLRLCNKTDVLRLPSLHVLLLCITWLFFIYVMSCRLI